jgi:AcrR family transcriptional regulator
MEDIAQQANLTRRTVYRHYPSHKEMLRAVVVEQSVKFITKMHLDLESITDFGEYFVEALIYTIKRGSAAPTHAFLFDFNDLPLVHEMFLASEALLEQGAQLWQTVYNTRGGGSLDMNMLTEWYNRITVSYLTIPSPHYHDDTLRELLAKLVKPVLTR